MADSDNNSGDDEDHTRTDIRRELSSMSFAEILQLKETLGAKVFNDAYHGVALRRHSANSQRPRFAKNRVLKAEKNAPLEMSSKRVAVGERRAGRRFTPRDPRFSGASGAFCKEEWAKNYSFIDEMHCDEENKLVDQLKSEKDPEEKRKIKLVLQRLRSRKDAESRKNRDEARAQAEKDENIDRLKQGKKPVFMSKKKIKEEELVEKYIQLKHSGKLDKHIERQRKKQASVSKKRLLG